MSTDTRVAVISIIVEEPECVPAINEILHSAADHIIGRMGIPYREKNIFRARPSKPLIPKNEYDEYIIRNRKT